MSMHGKISRAGGGRVKRALGVQAALEWAFRIEKAQLELPPPQDGTDESYGFGLEYVLCSAPCWAARLTVASTKWTAPHIRTPR